MSNRLDNKFTGKKNVYPERRRLCSACGAKRVISKMHRCGCGCLSCKGWFCNKCKI